MNQLELPWSVMLLPLVVLVILFLREILIAVRMPRFHPEHKMAIFNSIVLFGFFVAGVYGMRLLVLRDAAFSVHVPRYPNSRYAPERELLCGIGDRIYITNDAPSQVVQFYAAASSSSVFSVTLDDAAYTNGKLMLNIGSSTVFLTAVKEDGVTVLYYSASGLMEKVDR